MKFSSRPPLHYPTRASHAATPHQRRELDTFGRRRLRLLWRLKRAIQEAEAGGQASKARSGRAKARRSCRRSRARAGTQVRRSGSIVVVHVPGSGARAHVRTRRDICRPAPRAPSSPPVPCGALSAAASSPAGSPTARSVPRAGRQARSSTGSSCTTSPSTPSSSPTSSARR